MNGRQARALCPEAVVVPPRMHAYSEASKAVFAVFRDTTPLVEGISIDEAFLEVGGLRRIAGSPARIAVRLRADVRERVGLAITVGVARTKFLAKVASGVAKPDGLLVVPPDGEREFLRPLRVERLWGVGAVTAAKLHALGVHTVGDVADLEEGPLVSLLGRAAGSHLHALSHQRDPRRVDTGVRRRSIGSQRALGRGHRSTEELDAMLAGLVDRLARRLRGGDRVCRTVVLRMRFGDFTRATRSHTLVAPTDATDTLLDAARDLFTAALPLIGEKGLTLIGVSLAGLDDSSTRQLALPLDARPDAHHPDQHRETTLDATLDAVRARFGTASVARANQLGRDQGLSTPLLPEHE